MQGPTLYVADKTKHLLGVGEDQGGGELVKIKGGIYYD